MQSTHPDKYRGNRPASPRPRPAGRGTAVAETAGRHHSPPPPHRLPPGRDRESEMVRVRRRGAQVDRFQDGPADSLAERGGPRHPRPSTANWKLLCVSVAEGSGTATSPGSHTLVPRQEGSGARGCPPARPAPHGGEPGRGPGRLPADGCQDAGARGPEDDAVLRPCRRSGRGSCR